MALSNAEKAGLSAEEAAAFDEDEDADTAALKALADKLDQVDDDDDDADGAKPGAKAADNPAADGGAKAGEKADAKDDGASDKDDGDADIGVAEPFAAKVSGPEVGDYDAERGKLLDERKELRAKRRSGDIDDDTYDERLDDVNERLAKLDTSHALAQQNQKTNREIEEQRWLFTVQTFKENLREAGGIDYDKNASAAAAWDAHVKRLAGIKENDGKPYRWFLNEAHRATVADIRATAEALGLKVVDGKGAANAGDKAAVKAAIEQRRPKADTKPLNGLPTSGGADDGQTQGEFAHLDRMSGVALERALAKMSPEEQARYLESQE